MATQRVAVVTGSNKGVGFGVVRGLCKQFKGDVYLTSRDVGRGEAAMEALKKEGLSPKFHQLDIDDHSSIQKLADDLKQQYGGLDLLVNNAGIAYKNASTAPFSEQAEVTMRTNFWSTLEACDTLYPLLRPHARVVNVSSMSSQFALSGMSPERKQQVLSATHIDHVKKIMTEFVNDAKAGDHQVKGWANTAYGMSKVGVTAMSIIQQADLDAAGKQDIIVNACCPGYVDTDMTSHKGPLTIDQGAETPLYVALLPENCPEPRGKLIREKKVSPWN